MLDRRVTSGVMDYDLSLLEERRIIWNALFNSFNVDLGETAFTVMFPDRWSLGHASTAARVHSRISNYAN